jgi:hypothetical protein
MTTRKQDKFVVRFYESGLRDQIAEVARDSQRSMNAEIMWRLFRSLELEQELKRAHAVIDQLTAKGDA